MWRYQQLVTSLCLCLFSSVSMAAYHEVTILPREGKDAFGKAEYRIWLPDVKRLRGVIVRQHGCGPGARKLGLEHANDLQWQALARKWDCALLGSRLWAPKEVCATWTMPEDGSEYAFFSALEQLATKSGHPELKVAPWCLWGHSGGAAWILNMTYRHPGRVLAAFPKSGCLPIMGRVYPGTQPRKIDSNPKVLGVPMLISIGEKEAVPEQRFHGMTVAVREMLTYGRKRKAPWGLAVHPGCGHENMNTRLLAIRYFDRWLSMRLPTRLSGDLPVLKPVEFHHGYLITQKAYKKADTDDGQSHWVPDEAIARVWHEFEATGNIKDDSLPPAPSNTRVNMVNGEVTVTWEAIADMESGIQMFVIERDGKRIGEVKGAKQKRWNEEQSYLTWNYSDQPLWGKDYPPLQFVDRTEGASMDRSYRVRMVNRSGLISE